MATIVIFIIIESDVVGKIRPRTMFFKLAVQLAVVAIERQGKVSMRGRLI